MPYFDPMKQPGGPRKDQVCSIGSFTFEDVDRQALMTNSALREQKTVHLSEIYTKYIKIDLYQPYENIKNIFNQVSLVSVSCIGM